MNRLLTNSVLNELQLIFKQTSIAIWFQLLLPNSNNSIQYPYLPNPSARAGYDTRSIFKRSLTGLNSEFSFSWTSCFTKAEEPSLPYHLPIAGGRIIGFIPFPRVLVLCEMQSVSSIKLYIYIRSVLISFNQIVKHISVHIYQPPPLG